MIVEALLFMSVLATDRHVACVHEFVAEHQYHAAWDEATTAYKLAAERQNDGAVADAAFLLGLVAQRAGMPSSSIAAYEEAFQRGRTSTGVRYNLALALMATGERTRAEQLLRQALASADGADAGRVLDTLATLLAQDHPGEAQRVLEEFAFKVPLPPAARDRLFEMWIGSTAPPLAVEYVIHLIERNDSILALDVALRLLPGATGDTQNRLLAAALLALAHAPDPVGAVQRERRLEVLLAASDTMSAETRETITALLSGGALDMGVVEWPCTPLSFHREPLTCAQAARRLAQRAADLALEVGDVQRATTLLRLATFGTTHPTSSINRDDLDGAALITLVELHTRARTLDAIRPVVEAYTRLPSPPPWGRMPKLSPEAAPKRRADAYEFGRTIATLMGFHGVWTGHQAGFMSSVFASVANIDFALRVRPDWIATDAATELVASMSKAANGEWEAASKHGQTAAALLRQTGEPERATALTERMAYLATLAPDGEPEIATYPPSIPTPPQDATASLRDCYGLNFLARDSENRSPTTGKFQGGTSQVLVPDRVLHPQGLPAAYRFGEQHPTYLTPADFEHLNGRWQSYSREAFRLQRNARMTLTHPPDLYGGYVPYVVAVCIDDDELQRVATEEEIENILWDAIVTTASVPHTSEGYAGMQRAVNTYVGEKRSVIVLTSPEDQHYIPFQPLAWLPRDATDTTPPLVTWEEPSRLP
jgi:tetratricopeptide (TPR) repeat protein